MNKRDQSPLLVACQAPLSELAKRRIELIELALHSGTDIEPRTGVFEQHWRLVDGRQSTRKFFGVEVPSSTRGGNTNVYMATIFDLVHSVFPINLRLVALFNEIQH